MRILLFAVVSILLMLSGCSHVPDEPAYHSSSSRLPMGQSTFSAYVSETRAWLSQNRAFATADHQAELAANTPFELMPNPLGKSRKGILLIHGLSDSPYSFIDIAPVLSAMGFQVRTILLQGHGSRPADLIDADADDWRVLVSQQLALFRNEVDQLYLGGFSTGANLAAAYAAKHDDIQGLLLFSPGFKAKAQISGLAPVLPAFADWLYTPSLKDETNYVRYLTTPSNGFAQFYDTSAEVMFLLKQHRYRKPVFIAVSEADSVIDVQRVLSLFTKRMSHPSSRLIWYGEPPDSDDPRVIVRPAKVPEYRVSNFSHMAVLFDPKNPYYGINGQQRICNNGQDNSQHYWDCLCGKPIWYSSWGYNEADKPHGRLTFNPWFEQMTATIGEVFAGAN